jgi:hypothetical protein
MPELARGSQESKGRKGLVEILSILPVPPLGLKIQACYIRQLAGIGLAGGAGRFCHAFVNAETRFKTWLFVSIPPRFK